MDFDGFVLHGNISARIYLGSANSLIKHICDDSQKSALNSEDKQLDTQVFVPNTMNSASSYFAKGLYENSVSLEQTTSGANLKLGIRCSTSDSYYWTIFDNFRLYFYGNDKAADGIERLENADGDIPNVIYDMSGRRVAKPSKGLYIVGGKKVVIK